MNMNGFADYIKRDALDIVRFIADNIGGITGGVRVCQLAAAFGMECQPHNWGNVMDLAVHFQLELAADNNYWFEMPWPMEYADRAYHKDKFRVDQDGYIHAPTEPGLGLSHRPRRSRQNDDPHRQVGSNLKGRLSMPDQNSLMLWWQLELALCYNCISMNFRNTSQSDGMVPCPPACM